MKFTRADARELIKNMPDVDVRTLCEDLYADLLNRHAEAEQDVEEVSRRIASKNVTHGNTTVNVSSSEMMQLSSAQMDEIVRKIQQKLIQQSRRTRPHGFT